MRRNTLNYITGTALIATAAMLAVTSLVDPKVKTVAPAPEPSGTSVATAVIATATIERGRAVKPSDVASIGVDREIAETVANTPAQVVGAIALQTIAPGQLVGNFNVSKTVGAREGLALLVPAGMRAVALRISDDIAVGNFVRPGDRVDVLIRIDTKRASTGLNQPSGAAPTDSRESNVLLQNVEVLSIGQALNPSSNLEALRAQTVTVAVTPTDASRLNLTSELGRFYLALRHPKDKTLIAVSPIRRSNLLDPDAVGTRRHRDRVGPVDRFPTVRVITGGRINHVRTEEAGP